MPRPRALGVLHSRPVGEVDLIAKTPQLVKFCSKAFVPKLWNAHCPAWRSHTSHAPRFHLRRWMRSTSASAGRPLLDHIVQSRQVGVYSRRVAGIGLELLVILES